jgi:hypothetical protein
VPAGTASKRGESGFSRPGGRAGSMNRCKSARRTNARRCPACSTPRTSRNLGVGRDLVLRPALR